jgi:hypothetical protein
VQVVAVFFPEAWIVLPLHGESPYPFGALPEIEMRHQEAGRPAVVRVELGAHVLVCDPGLTVENLLKWKVCGVTAVRVRHHEIETCLDLSEQGVQ